MVGPKIFSGTLLFRKNQEYEEVEDDIELVRVISEVKALVCREELFFIPHEDDFIFYNPLQGYCFLINGVAKRLVESVIRGDLDSVDEKELAIINYFFVNGVFEKKDSIDDCSDNSACDSEFGKEYLPTSVVICPTSDCNLRCVYCYASGGDVKKSLSIDSCEKAIALVVKNALKKGENLVRISFHGGGEPTTNATLVKSAVDYAKRLCSEKGLGLDLNIGTNLFTGKGIIKYIADNFNSATVSVDGPKEIHDKHRPSVDGSGSFDKVVDGIRLLDSEGFDYSIRATITADSVDRMVDIVRFFSNSFGTKKIHLEPVYLIERADSNELKGVDIDKFERNLLECDKVASDHGIHLVNCGNDLSEIRTYFCGAVTCNSFWLTPENNISTCGEVLRKSDPRSDIFFIGRFDEMKGEFIFDYAKIEKLRRRSVCNLNACSSCFAKYHCAGQCPAKVFDITGDIMETDGMRNCIMHRSILKEKLLRILSKDELRLSEEDYIEFGNPDRWESMDLDAPKNIK